MKFALIGLLALCGGFGYVVYKHVTGQQAEVTDTDESETSEQSADALNASGNATDKSDPFAEDLGGLRTVAGTRPRLDAADDLQDLGQQSEPGMKRIPTLDDPSELPAGETRASTPLRFEQLDNTPAASTATRNRAEPTDEFDDFASRPRPLRGPATVVAQAPSDPFAQDEPQPTATQPPATPIYPRNSPQAQQQAQKPAVRLPALPIEIEEPERTPSRLDGFEVAPQAPASTRTPRQTIEQPADLLSQDDPRLGDYVPEDLNTRRASSRTVVGRAAPPAQPSLRPSPQTRSGDPSPATAQSQRPAPGLHVAANDDFNANRAASSATIIEPRRATPVSSTFEEFSPRSQRPAPASTGDIHPQGEVYTVAANDNFWSISKQQYGTARMFKALTKYNADRVPDPQNLKPGMQIATPPRAVLEAKYPDLIDQPAGSRAPQASPVAETTVESGGYFLNETGQPMYQVQNGDTLSGISQRHLGRAGRANELFELNRGVLPDANALKIGTVLHLPADASRVSLSPGAPQRR